MYRRNVGFLALPFSPAAPTTQPASRQATPPSSPSPHTRGAGTRRAKFRTRRASPSRVQAFARIASKTLQPIRPRSIRCRIQPGNRSRS
jgi:hypothetical protein